MSRNLTIIVIIASIIVALALLTGLVWANRQVVQVRPVEKTFLVPWLAARTFMEYGNSPYSQPAAQRAQIQYYGRLANPDQDPLDLWLPFPVELFYFPFAVIPDYVLARSFWMAGLELSLAVMALLALRLDTWKPGRLVMAFVPLASIFWIYGLFSINASSVAGYAAIALVGFLLALREGHDEVAGALLLVSLSLPRLTGVLFIFLVWWIAYHRRWRIFWGFLMSLVILLAISFFFLPDWFLPSLRGMFLHNLYNPALSIWQIFGAWSPGVGVRIGWGLTVVLVLVLFFEWGNVLQPDSRRFLWTISLTIAVSPLLGFGMDLGDYSLLFLPLILFLGFFAERFPRSRKGSAMGIALLSVFSGLWLLAILLNAVRASPGLMDTLILLLPTLMVVGLFWMRWWISHPLHNNLESIP
jgi:hypothetical protein